MSKISTHCDDCLQVLGEEFKYVHEYLDEFAKKWNPFIYLEYHRQFRHHDNGVKEVREKWGEYAEKAAKLHIIRDNMQYVYFNINTLREDDIEELYQKALKFCYPIQLDNKKEDI